MYSENDGMDWLSILKIADWLLRVGQNVAYGTERALHINER